MNTTAFIVFAEKCGGCAYYKSTLRPQINEALMKKGIEIVERTASDPAIGLTPENSGEYKFLELVRFYPCIMLIRNDVLDKGLSPDDILSYAYVYNGLIVHNSRGVTISSVSPGKYEFTLDEFKRFANDYKESPQYSCKITPSKKKEPNTIEFKPPAVTYGNKHYNCKRIHAIPYTKK